MVENLKARGYKHIFELDLNHNNPIEDFQALRAHLLKLTKFQRSLKDSKHIRHSKEKELKF